MPSVIAMPMLRHEWSRKGSCEAQYNCSHWYQLSCFCFVLFSVVTATQKLLRQSGIHRNGLICEANLSCNVGTKAFSMKHRPHTKLWSTLVKCHGNWCGTLLTLLTQPV